MAARTRSTAGRKTARRMPRVEIFRDRFGEYRFRLKGANGEIVAQGESHADASKARRSWNTVVRLARGPVQFTAVAPFVSPRRPR